MVRQSSIQAVLDDMVLEHISPQAKEILRTLGSVADEPQGPRVRVARDLSGRPKQLAKDTEALERIKVLWADPSITIAEISRQVDRPRQTVEAVIKRQLDRGDLPPRAESGHIADEA